MGKIDYMLKTGEIDYMLKTVAREIALQSALKIDGIIMRNYSTWEQLDLLGNVYKGDLLQ